METSKAGKSKNDVKTKQPNYKKAMWSPIEDELLLDAVRRFGLHDWDRISTVIHGRSKRQCRERWDGVLNPTLTKAPWTPEEDEMLKDLHEQLGNKWALIAQHMKGRSTIMLKNRWNYLLRHAQPEKSAIISQLQEQIQNAKQQQQQQNKHQMLINQNNNVFPFGETDVLSVKEIPPLQNNAKNQQIRNEILSNKDEQQQKNDQPLYQINMPQFPSQPSSNLIIPPITNIRNNPNTSVYFAPLEPAVHSVFYTPQFIRQSNYK